MPSSKDNITDSSSSENLYQEVYHELRQLARAKMSREYLYSTLQGTALVHEAWLRMGGDEQPRWQNRAHFFGAAAEAMRRILVERARRYRSERHGGSLKRVSVDSLDQLQGEPDQHNEFLLINDALLKLEKRDAPKAKLVKLRYFLGLSYDEAAQNLGISVRTAKRWWHYARSWLHCEISSVRSGS